jgi:hypothetical protein
MAENKKREQLLKGNRRNHKEINRRNPLHMIAKGRFPRLQWPIAPRHHVDRNRGLGDLDAELEQLAMDLGSAPQRVLKTHYFGSGRALVPSQNFVHRRNLGDFRPRGAGNH